MIDAAYLREQITALVAERDQRLAALNAAIGGLEILEHLLARVEASPTSEDRPAEPSPTDPSSSQVTA